MINNFFNFDCAHISILRVRIQIIIIIIIIIIIATTTVIICWTFLKSAVRKFKLLMSMRVPAV